MINKELLTVLTLAFPLLGFVINGIFSQKLGKKAGIIGTIMIALSFLCAICLTQEVSNSGGFKVNLYNWISTGLVNIDFSFYIDQLSTWMMLIITGIGSLIHLYSTGYMSHDKGVARFFSYLNLFIFSMLLLVMGSNLIILFMGWEGVGLCSYLLIGFWYKNKEFGHAARKAFIMNRIGDLGLLIGIFLCFINFGTIEMAEIQTIASSGAFLPVVYTTITICLFIGAIGKSAQVPLFTWLPDAMAGPTPVSALIHAATMVTAGVYLIVRNAGLFEMAPYTQHLILIIGLITALLGAAIALFQDDIKKILAYSTVSQLGFMFLALGVGAYTTAMFHLTTHAFFKALLFLGAGSVIHAMSDEQSILKMGGLKSKIKITHITFLLGTLAIIGFPLFSGFFSKDEILEKVFSHSVIVWGLAWVAAIMTLIYMLRLYFLTFWGKFRGGKVLEKKIHESPLSMTLPLMVLAVLSVFGGLLKLPKWIGVEHAHLDTWLGKIESLKDLSHHGHLDHNTEMYLIIFAVLAVLVLGFIVYSYFKKSNFVPAKYKRTGIPLIGENKFYIDEIYNWSIVKRVEGLSSFLYNFIENKMISPLFMGGGRMFGNIGRMLSVFQNGNIEYYISYMSLAMLGLMAVYFIFIQ